MSIRHLTAALAAVIFAGPLLAQTPSDDQVRFAKPVRLMAGEKYLGEGRLYPSPAVIDVNGDGALDVVIGDLWGHPTVARGHLVDSKNVLGAEAPMNMQNGEPLKFNNW